MMTRIASTRSGIAIGPVLFVVAILAVLVGVIASGSGGFTASSGEESLRLAASQLVQQAATMKIGADRILSKGYAASQIAADTDGDGNNNLDGASDTTAMPADQNRNLFSPSGGGVSRPLPPRNAVNASADISGSTPYSNGLWQIFIGNVSGVGTSGGDLVAVLPVTSAVCDQINGIVVGRASDGTVAAPTIGAFSEVAAAVGDFSFSSTGRTQACVIDNNEPYNWFYVVLAAG